MRDSEGWCKTDAGTCSAVIVEQAALELVQVGVGRLALQAGPDLHHVRLLAWSGFAQIHRPPDLQVALAVQVGGLDEAGVIRQRGVEAEEVCWEELLIIHSQHMTNTDVPPLDVMDAACQQHKTCEHSIAQAPGISGLLYVKSIDASIPLTLKTPASPTSFVTGPAAACSSPL